MYRRWLYPTFSTPVLVEPTRYYIADPLALPPARKRRPPPRPFVVRESNDTIPPFWTEPQWEYPRKKPWAFSEFEHFEDVQPAAALPPWVQPSWEHPRRKAWVRPGLGETPTQQSGPDIQWWVEFAVPVLPKPTPHTVIEPQPVPLKPVIPNPLPFPEWDLVRRRRVPRRWTMYLANGAGFGDFTQVEWEFPRRKPWSGNSFEVVDDVPLPKFPVIWQEPNWQYPKLRPMTQYRAPFIPLVVREDEFVPNTPYCPRPMRRPDTKC